jgi:hypothetical protein
VAVQLTPATFECPIHHVDLTAVIEQALTEEGPPLAYGKRPFRVPVSCPGDGTSGAHQQTCAGEYES